MTKLVDLELNFSTNKSITSLYYSHLSIIVIFVILLGTLGNWGLQQVNAQNTTTANFELYTSPTLGLSIEHPSDWKGEEFETSGGRMVKFQPADEITIRPFFDITVSNVTQYLDTDTLTLKNRTLQEEAKFWQDAYSLFNTYKPLRQNNLTVAGNDGIKMEYMFPDYYAYEVFAIINGKLYNFKYEDDELGNVPVNVRIANKMVESFKLQNKEHLISK